MSAHVPARCHGSVIGRAGQTERKTRRPGTPVAGPPGEGGTRAGTLGAPGHPEVQGTMTPRPVKRRFLKSSMAVLMSASA